MAEASEPPSRPTSATPHVPLEEPGPLRSELFNWLQGPRPVPSSSVPYARLSQAARALQDSTESYSFWWLDLQVREPQLDSIGCCNLCRGTSWKPYPVSFQITTMSDSPMLCANYMVIRRWDEDFMKLAASLRSQFAFNTELMRGLKSLGPRRLTSVSDDELLLQCGLHKRLLKWILAHEVFYSSHDLHAFLGCREEECPSNRTDAVRKFPLYPPRL